MTMKECLSVGLVSKQDRITLVWNDVVDADRLDVPAFNHAFLKQRMRPKVPLPNSPPCVAVTTDNYEMVSGEQVLANLYDYTKNGYVIFTARCVNGKVTDVWDHRSSPYKQSSGTSSKNDRGKEKKSDEKYPASDYVHPDDFYYDYYDDFYDYEDAEDYWEEYG